MLRHKDIPTGQVNILDSLELAIAQHGHLEVSFCGPFDLLVGAVEEDIVDGGGEEGEEDHEDAEDDHTFQDVHC